jgi:Rps23 Pro-64 3,4-dihydroxylase Tpa1-like proline 4-hydroxylase
MRHVVIDGFLSTGEVIHADCCWPKEDWAGWVRYSPEYEHKLASDLVTPLPPFLSALLARMAAVNLGALLGMSEAVADLSLYGAGLFSYPKGAGLGSHVDADCHPRLGLRRAWSAVLFVHSMWDCGAWGGELCLEGVDAAIIEPRPGRLAVFNCMERHHHVAPVYCPRGAERRCLALFGYLPEASAGARPRAVFADERAKGR